MTDTTNYKLKEYAATDPVDLQAGYNASMTIIDAQMKANANAASNAASAASTASSKATAAQSTANTANSTANSALSKANSIKGLTVATADKVLTVAQLATVKVDANGILYVPQS